MRKRMWVLGGIVALALAAPGPAQEPPAKPAGEPGKSAEQAKEQKAKAAGEHERQAAEGRAFGKDQEKTVRDWFAKQENQATLPPGLAKREELPPGMQKHIERDGTLPPELRGRTQPLPEALASQLPPPPAGVTRGVIGDRVVLVEESTGKVLDVIKDALPGAKKQSEKKTTY